MDMGSMVQRLNDGVSSWRKAVAFLAGITPKQRWLQRKPVSTYRQDLHCILPKVCTS